MPYYCTVPRCTSMAGKAKNVSFHQFPRDERLAERWNTILKRGKPYTKYSKVCSRHFRPEDYTMTGVMAKTKGNWRTLRKDAVPSQNLPSDCPAPTHHRSRASLQAGVGDVTEQQMQQQLAHAVYVQTMLAVHAAGLAARPGPAPALLEAPTSPEEMSENDENSQDSEQGSDVQQFEDSQTEEDIPATAEDMSTSMPAGNATAETSQIYLDPQEFFRNSSNILNPSKRSWFTRNSVPEYPVQHSPERAIKPTKTSYKCEECSKCFKDPDVFLLHRRWHVTDQDVTENVSRKSKEIYPARQKIVKKLTDHMNGSAMCVNEPNEHMNNVSEMMENHILTAMKINMENYIKTVINATNLGNNFQPPEDVLKMRNSYVSNSALGQEKFKDNIKVEADNRNDDLNESKDSDKLVIDENFALN